MNANLRTTFEKLIRRAGLQTWPRLFRNLRASYETDLVQNHPIHVVTAWVGNTPRIALGHYLQTLEADFEKAIGGARSGARTGKDRGGRHRPKCLPGKPLVRCRPPRSATVQTIRWPRRDLNPHSQSRETDFESAASAIPPLGLTPHSISVSPTPDKCCAAGSGALSVGRGAGVWR
jgi:hypothetical protein